MRALESGFRLRLEDAARALEDGVRRQADGWLLKRPQLPLMLELRDGSRAALLLANPMARRGWVQYATKGARFVARTLVPIVRFDARPVKGGIEAFHEEQWFPIRWDQLAPLRTWGIGFEGPPALIDALERHVFAETTRRLSACLRTAGKILSRQHFDAAWLPKPVADPLERLIHDLLNEETHVAAHANVLEDFMEKTDLRVRYPGLGRKNGARVQVSWATDDESAERKVASLRRPEEMVWATPHHLGPAVGKAPRELADDFGYAIRKAAAHPLGPLAALGPEVRTQIREAVRESAFSSTARLRQREKEGSAGAKPAEPQNEPPNA